MENLAQATQSMLGLTLTPHQIELIRIYERELIEWNSRFNLTAIRSPEEIRAKHFLDSFTCLLALREAVPGRLIDVGTGAGFPGLALKILLPGMQVTLVESVGKKLEFCRHIVRALHLEGVELFQMRAEEAGQMKAHREQYDWAVARAVAGMPILAEYLLPLVKLGGRALAQKGESGPAEAHAAEKATRILGGEIERLIPVHLPGVAEDRYLVVARKIAATPALYPRRSGVPSKNPLG